MTITTSILGAQHPNAGGNIQQTMMQINESLKTLILIIQVCLQFDSDSTSPNLIKPGRCLNVLENSY